MTELETDTKFKDQNVEEKINEEITTENEKVEENKINMDEDYNVEPENNLTNIVIWAAKEEHPLAMYLMGIFFLGYYKVKPDFEKAVKWLKRSIEYGANENFGGVEYYLAHCYENGFGIEKDTKKALELYNISADKKYPKAMKKLSVCYAKGILGCEQNLKFSKKWNSIYEDEAEYEWLMSNDLIQAGYRANMFAEEEQLIDVINDACEVGNTEAEYCLGLLYDVGFGGVLEQNEEMALECFKKATAKGHAGAMFCLARYIEEGKGGTERMPDVAMKLYKEAAHMGDRQAQEVINQIKCMPMDKETREMVVEARRQRIKEEEEEAKEEMKKRKQKQSLKVKIRSIGSVLNKNHRNNTKKEKDKATNSQPQQNNKKVKQQQQERSPKVLNKPENELNINNNLSDNNNNNNNNYNNLSNNNENVNSADNNNLIHENEIENENAYVNNMDNNINQKYTTNRLSPLLEVSSSNEEDEEEEQINNINNQEIIKEEVLKEDDVAIITEEKSLKEQNLNEQEKKEIIENEISSLKKQYNNENIVITENNEKIITEEALINDNENENEHFEDADDDNQDFNILENEYIGSEGDETPKEEIKTDDIIIKDEKPLPEPKESLPKKDNSTIKYFEVPENNEVEKSEMLGDINIHSEIKGSEDELSLFAEDNVIDEENVINNEIIDDQILINENQVKFDDENKENLEEKNEVNTEKKEKKNKTMEKLKLELKEKNTSVKKSLNNGFKKLSKQSIRIKDKLMKKNNKP